MTNSTLISYASAAARLTGSAVVILVGLALMCVPFVQPLFFLNYAVHPIGYLFPVLSIARMHSAHCLSSLRASGVPGEGQTRGTLNLSILYVRLHTGFTTRISRQQASERKPAT